MKKRIPVSKNIPVRSDDQPQPVPVENIRPQPTVVSYKANPNPPAKHTVIHPAGVYQNEKMNNGMAAAAKEVHEDMKQNRFGDEPATQKPAGKPTPLWAKIVAAPFIILIFLAIAAILIGIITVIVWFIGWAIFGAW